MISEISPDENDHVGNDELGGTKKICFDESAETIPVDSEEPDKQSNSNSPFATTSFANKNEVGMEAMDDTTIEDVILPEENDFSEPDSVNDELNPEAIADRSKSFLVTINGFRWKLGQLQLRMQLSTGESDWVSFQDAKLDFPRQTAAYTLSEYKPRGRDHGRDRVISWAKKVTRDMNRAIRRIVR